MLAHGWQTIPEKGVVRSRKLFKFCWTPTISLEWPIVSGAVNLVRGECHNLLMVVDHPHRLDLYSDLYLAARPSKINCLITI